MFFALVLALSLQSSLCDNPFARGDTVYPQTDTAQALLLDIPSTDSTAGMVGILLTTRVFAQASRSPRKDVDSALTNLARACALCPDASVYQAYWCTARMLRVQYRLQHETHLILDTIKIVFQRADSVARSDTANRAVAFIVGCLFQNASPFMGTDATYYWNRARSLLTPLEHEGDTPNAPAAFYTEEIRANIKLNLAHLSAKDGSVAGKDERDALLQSIITLYPKTLAAKRAVSLLAK